MCSSWSMHRAVETQWKKYIYILIYIYVAVNRLHFQSDSSHLVTNLSHILPKKTVRASCCFWVSSCRRRHIIFCENEMTRLSPLTLKIAGSDRTTARRVESGWRKKQSGSNESMCWWLTEVGFFWEKLTAAFPQKALSALGFHMKGLLLQMLSC